MSVCWEGPVITGLSLLLFSEEISVVNVDAAFIPMECVQIASTSLAWNIILIDVGGWIFSGLTIDVVYIWWFDVTAVCVGVAVV